LPRVWRKEGYVQRVSIMMPDGGRKHPFSKNLNFYNGLYDF
jgi:hypothetical protein